jgi:hypothetical protein
MKIVIDIPEEVYKSIQDNDYCGILNSDMYNAIKNGIPHETVTEFAGRCRECGAKYGKLLEKQTDGDLVKENTDLVKEDAENADKKGIFEETVSQSLVKDGNFIKLMVDTMKNVAERIKNMPNEEFTKIIVENIKEQTDGDLINRTDLLKELEKWDWQDTYLPIHFAELVADLPSAEKTTINPEKTTIKAE